MKKKLMQLLSTFIAAVLMLGIVPINNASAEEVTETEVIGQITEKLQESFGATEVKVESTDNGFSLETDVVIDEAHSDSELQAIEEASAYDVDPSAEQLTVTNANVKLTFNYETNEVIVESSEIDQEGNLITNEYNVAIDNASKDQGIDAVFTDKETGEVYQVDSEELQASFIWLIAIPIGVVIGEVLLSHLIAAGLAMVLSGVTYLAISEFLKRPKTYNHYMAHIDKNKKFWVGNGISKMSAVIRLGAGNSTWSTSSTNAATVAKEASPIGKAIGPEIDGGNRLGKLYHYHPVTGYKQGVSIRLEGAHAFFGSPQ